MNDKDSIRQEESTVYTAASTILEESESSTRDEDPLFRAMFNEHSWIADLIDADPFAEPMMFPYYEPTGFSFRGDGASTVLTSTRSNVTTVRSTASTNGAQRKHLLTEKLKGLPIGEMLEKLQKSELLKARPQTRHLVFDKPSQQPNGTEKFDSEEKPWPSIGWQCLIMTDNSEEELEERIYSRMHQMAVLAMTEPDPARTMQGVKDKLDLERQTTDQPATENLQLSAVAVACLQLGNVHNDQGNYKDAMDNYFEALDIFQQLHGNDHPRVGETFCNMGRTLLNDKGARNSQALDCLEEAALILKLKGEKRTASQEEQLGEALHLMGQAQLLLSDEDSKQLEEAIQSLQESLKLHKAGKNSGKALETMTLIGTVFSKQKDFARAEKHYDDCMKETHGDLEGTGNIYLAMGDMYLEHPEDKHDRVMDSYQEALSISQTEGLESTELKAKAFVALGNYYCRLGEEDLALDYFQQVPSPLQSSNFKAHVQMKLSILYFRTGDTTSAMDKLEEFRSDNQADAIAPESHAVALLTQGACHFVSGNNKEAKKSYKDALVIAHKLNPSEQDERLLMALKKSIAKTSRSTLGKVYDRFKQSVGASKGA